MTNLNIPWDIISDSQLEQYTQSRTGLEKTLAQALLDTREELRRTAEALNLEDSRAISSELEARHDRDRARLRTVLSLLGVKREVVDEICAKMADVIKANPDGFLTFTHNSELPSFASLVAMWWQDEDYGSSFNELLWKRDTVEVEA